MKYDSPRSRRCGGPIPNSPQPVMSPPQIVHGQCGIFGDHASSLRLGELQPTKPARCRGEHEVPRRATGGVKLTAWSWSTAQRGGAYFRTLGGQHNAVGENLQRSPPISLRRQPLDKSNRMMASKSPSPALTSTARRFHLRSRRDPVCDRVDARCRPRGCVDQPAQRHHTTRAASDKSSSPSWRRWYWQSRQNAPPPWSK